MGSVERNAGILRFAVKDSASIRPPTGGTAAAAEISARKEAFACMGCAATRKFLINPCNYVKHHHFLGSPYFIFSFFLFYSSSNLYYWYMYSMYNIDDEPVQSAGNPTYLLLSRTGWIVSTEGDTEDCRNCGRIMCICMLQL